MVISSYHYEFGGEQFFDTLAEAERARQKSMEDYLAVPGHSQSDVLYRDMKKTRPKKTLPSRGKAIGPRHGRARHEWEKYTLVSAP